MKRFAGPIGKRKRGEVYTFLFISYIAVLLLTLSSGFFFFLHMNRQITSQNERISHLLLTQIRESWEQNTREMERLVNEAATSYRLEQYAKGDSAVDREEVRRMLSTIRGVDSPFLLDKAIYFTDTDQLLTETQMMSGERYFGINYPPVSQEPAAFREAVLDQPHFRDYLPMVAVRQYLDQEKRVIPFVQSFPIRLGQPIAGQVVCFIDVEAFSQLMDRMHSTSDSNIYILDKHYQFILANSEAPDLDEATLQRLSQGLGIDGSIVNTQASSDGWVFVLATPRELYHAQSRGTLLSLLAVSGVYLLVGLLLVRFFTERNYRPIREINNLVLNRASKNRQLGKNELDIIRDALVAQYSDSEKKAALLETQRPFVMRDMLARLMTGTVRDYDQWQRHLAGAGVQLAFDSYLVVSVEIDEDSQFFEEGSQEESRTLARVIVQNVGCELFDADFQCLYLELQQNVCVFLLGLPGKDGAVLGKQAQDSTRRLVEFAVQCGLLFYAGIGSIRPGLAGVPLSYDESTKALEYSRFLADTPIVEYASLEGRDFDYYYPAESQHQLTAYLRTGDHEQARHLLEYIFQTNTSQKRISVNAARSLIAELYATVDRALGGVPAESFAIDQYMENPSLERALTGFTELIRTLGKERAQSQASTKSGRLADAMAVFIRDHIEDPGLDLNLLSQEFGMTPQYLSNLFKRHNNENIKDFTSRLRLERAKELLRTTDAPVKEIARQLGYAGEIGIIRLFKRYENTTPGEYRSLHRQP